MQNPPPNHPATCRHWPFWFVILLLLALLIAAFWTHPALGPALLRTSRHPTLTACHGKGQDEFPPFDELHSYGAGTTKIARIPFSGVLSDPLQPSPLHTAIRRIRAARQDNNVAAILLEIDSPGGELSAADHLYHELLLFKQSRPNRRLVVLVHGIAASGGYYASLPADRIIAQPTAIIGSIGVLLHTLNFKPLGDKLGISDATIKSGEHEDLLNPLHELSPAARTLLQNHVNAMHARFISLVASARSLPPSTVRTLADGRIFTPQQALEAHLIDRIGYFEDALSTLRTLLNRDDLFLVTYAAPPTLTDLLFGPLETYAPHTPLHALSHIPSPSHNPLDVLWHP